MTQCYCELRYVVTPLAARLFAAWTFTSAVIRCWAAYTITDTVYVLH